jgi:hypothetical protein
MAYDRFFLDRIGTDRIAFEGERHVEDYEADEIRRLAPDAVATKRIKYKKFAR